MTNLVEDMMKYNCSDVTLLCPWALNSALVYISQAFVFKHRAIIKG